MESVEVVCRHIFRLKRKTNMCRLVWLNRQQTWVLPVSIQHG